MANASHTYGAKCRLAPVLRVDREDGLPPIEAQYFYSSMVPIDDPLSTGSVTGPPESRSSKNQLRPFGRGDNNALEKAWLSLMSDEYRKGHETAKGGKVLDANWGQDNIEKLAFLVRDLATKHWDKHRSGHQSEDLSLPTYEALPTTPVSACCPELMLDISEELDNTFCALVRRRNSSLDPDEVVKQVVVALGHMRDASNVTTDDPGKTGEASNSRPGTGYSSQPAQYPAIRISKKAGESRNVVSQFSRSQTPVGSPIPTRPPVLDDGISGKPFVRVDSPDVQEEQAVEPSSFGSSVADGPRQRSRRTTLTMLNPESAAPKEKKYSPEAMEVAVGLSRLHMVSLPSLQMKPIYWSPVNDVAVVMRATWFYRLVPATFEMEKC